MLAKSSRALVRSGARTSAREMPAVLLVPAMVHRQGKKAGQWRGDDRVCAQDSNKPASPHCL